MTIGELLNLLIPIYGTMFLVIVGFLFFRHWRTKGKIPVLILKKTKKYGVTYRHTEGNEVLFPEWKQNPTFETDDFFQELKPKWKFWRLPKLILVIPEFAAKALKWNIGSMRVGWTMKEDKDYITKMVLKSRQKKQLISNTWGMIILFAIIFVGFIVFLGFNRIGAF